MLCASLEHRAVDDDDGERRGGEARMGMEGPSTAAFLPVRLGMDVDVDVAVLFRPLWSTISAISASVNAFGWDGLPHRVAFPLAPT